MKTGYSLAIASILSLTAFVSNAEIIPSDRIEIQWSANCSDCLGLRGENGERVPVTGVLNLTGVSGDGTGNIGFDTSNIISLQYDGPSNHVDKFIMQNADYSTTDDLHDESDLLSSDFGHVIPSFMIEQNVNTLDQEYSIFSESITGSGWFNPETSSYSAELSFSTFVPIDEFGEYIKFSEMFQDEFFFLEALTFDFNVSSNGDWFVDVTSSVFNIDSGSEEFDFGENMSIAQLNQNGTPFVQSQPSDPGNAPVNNGSGQSDPSQPIDPNNSNAVSVSEPTTLAIFAMSLLGLAGIRKKRV